MPGTLKVKHVIIIIYTTDKQKWLRQGEYRASIICARNFQMNQ